MVLRMIFDPFIGSGCVVPRVSSARHYRRSVSDRRQRKVVKKLLGISLVRHCDPTLNSESEVVLPSICRLPGAGAEACKAVALNNPMPS